MDRQSRRRHRVATGGAARLWKVELQQLADETNLAIAVCHFPPGTSKWNKIEPHRRCRRRGAPAPIIAHPDGIDP
jgi:hypothetical protein